ncbi:hypothetical protein GCM10025734_79700 [Kitasatospora paranensis]
MDLAATRTVSDAVSGCQWTFPSDRPQRGPSRRRGRRRRTARAGHLPHLWGAGGRRHGREVLAGEPAKAGDPGCRQQILVGGGLRAEHVPALRAAGFDAFHVAGVVRTGGWAGQVDTAEVAEWRALG